MSQTYIFHDQAGVIPGIPFTFSHCTVEVDDDGKFHVLSLPVAPAIVESTIEPVTPAQEQPVEPKQEQPTQQEQLIEQVQKDISELEHLNTNP